MPVLRHEAPVVGIRLGDRFHRFAGDSGQGIASQPQVFAGKIDFSTGEPQRVQQQILGHGPVGVRDFTQRREFGVLHHAGVTEPLFQLLLALADVVLKGFHQMGSGFAHEIQTEHGALLPLNKKNGRNGGHSDRFWSCLSGCRFGTAGLGGW